MTVMDIDKTQLQNLINNRVPFLFIDLRLQATNDSSIESLMSQAQRVVPEKVIEFVKGQASDEASPVVLVCETGEEALRLGEELAREGFINVCYLEGGTQALSSGHH